MYQILMNRQCDVIDILHFCHPEGTKNVSPAVTLDQSNKLYVIKKIIKKMHFIYIYSVVP